MLPADNTFKNISILKVLGILLLSIILILFEILGFFTGVKSSLNDIFGESLAKSRIFIGKAVPESNYFSQRNEFIREIKSLEEKISKLNSENVALKEQMSEISLINTQQKFTSPNKFVPALVLQYLPDKYGYVLLNKGKREGVEIGSAVVYENYLLGIVTEVYEKNSLIRLINSSESKITGIIQGQNTKGVISGDIAKGLIMSDIPLNANLEVGDFVLSTKIDNTVPEGLIIGKVENIDEKPNLPSKTAKLEILADLKNLQNVFIIKYE